MNKDQQLSEALRTWKVGAPVAARFESDVWTRIRAREEVSSHRFFVWFLALFEPLPFWRVAGLSTLAIVLLGVGLGAVSAASANERQRSELERRYVQSVDPYLRTSNPEMQ